MSNFNFPVTYNIKSTAVKGGAYKLSSEKLQDIETAPPANFGGPGNIWSPEELFVGVIADCFMMTFRAISEMSKLDWISLDCSANGVLERIDGVIQFTEVIIYATLKIEEGGNKERAIRIMEKAEKNCLVTNSIKTKVHLDAKVMIN